MAASVDTVWFFFFFFNEMLYFCFLDGVAL